MHNFIEKFTKINDICKKFAGNCGRQIQMYKKT